MADFSPNILEFQQNGTYEYKFDAVGNLYFNSSSADFSQVYLKLPLTNVVYDNSKIAKFYDPTFTEFVPATSSAEPTSSVAFWMEISLSCKPPLPETISVPALIYVA